MRHSIKGRIKKVVWIFLSLLLVFNIMAETISTLLLPTVQLENIKEGEIESKLFSSGAISREDCDEITIKATQAGIVKVINYQSGDSINTVRPIVIISTELSEEEQKEICSPARGKVSSMQVYEGQIVSRGEALFKVKPYSKLWSLTFEVTAAQAGYINVPQEVEWSVDKQIYKTKVTGKNNSSTKGYVTISCDLEEEEINKLGRGDRDSDSGVNKNFYISTDVTITSTSGTYPTTVPNSALVKEHGLNYIYVIQKKEGTFDTTYTVKKVEVLVIKQGDYKTAIQGDISLEDQVVKNTSKVLEDDMEVLVE